MRKLWAPREERGAILVMSTVGFVLAIVASALAVDLGTLAQERRRDQKVADLAALDAIRDIPANWQIRAEESAARNGFPTGPGYSVQAIEGRKVNGSCEALPGAGTVCVTVQSPHKNNFVPGGNVVTTAAVAGMSEEAGFSIGSALASADLPGAQVPVLSRILARMLGISTADLGTLDLVGYQGLMDADVSLGELQTQLNVATVDELLAKNITVYQLLSATGTILNNKGVLAHEEVDLLAGLISSDTHAVGSTVIQLGDFIQASQGTDDAVARTKLSVFNLIGGSVGVANKDSFLEIADAFASTGDVTLPAGAGTYNLGTYLGLKVVEPMQTYIGPVDGFAETQQVEITLKPNIAVKVPVLSIPVLNVTGELPIKIVSAGAKGTLTDIVCADPGQGISVRVDPKAVSASVASTLTANVAGLVGTTVAGTGVKPETTGPSQTLTFAYDEDFFPTEGPLQTTPNSLGLTNLTSTTGGNVTITVADLPLLPDATVSVPIAAIMNAVFNVLDPMFAAIDNRLVGPALRALGLNIGSADVLALKDAFDPSKCGQPGLLQ